MTERATPERMTTLTDLPGRRLCKYDKYGRRALESSTSSPHVTISIVVDHLFKWSSCTVGSPTLDSIRTRCLVSNILQLKASARLSSPSITLGQDQLILLA